MHLETLDGGYYSGWKPAPNESGLIHMSNVSSEVDVRILAINGTYRKNGTTGQLVRKALEGAASVGADTEMVLLAERDVGYCRNCLTCYKDLESEIAPCSINDDVQGILEAIRDADGVFFASPVHNGFVSGLMNAFIERATWTLLRPTGEILGVKGMPEPRLTDKTRAVATVVSAGGIPSEMREYCDLGSPWLQEQAAMICNGECIGDIYAGAVFSKELEGDEWSRAYLLRELTEEQLQETYNLGVTMVHALNEEKVRAYDPVRSIQLPEQQAK